MKVFFITHTFGGTGGSELYVKDLLTELSKNGIEIFVFAPEQGKNIPKNVFGVKDFYLTPSFGHHAFHKFEYLLFYKKAIKLAKDFGAQIIHAHNSCFPGIIGHQIKKKLNIPLITCVEGITEGNKGIHQRVVVPFERFWWPRLNCDAFISWHKYTLDRFLIPWGVPKEKTMVIHGAVDVEKFSPKASGKKFTEKYGEHLIGTARSLNYTNGERILHIVRAMFYVEKKHPEYKFLIFGGGEAIPKMKKTIKELGLRKNVILCGEIKAEEVPAMYSACTIAPFVFRYGPITSSGLMEAMACGKAIVASDYEGVKDYVKDAAVLVDDEPKEFAKGIIQLIENTQLREMIEKKARKYAVDGYSIKSIAKQYIGLYNKLAPNQETKK